MRSTGVCLVAEPARCGHCLTCSREYPTNLDVHAVVSHSDAEDPDRVLCDCCANGCSRDASNYSLPDSL